MRILHTSDWHLGRTLHGASRRPEHEAFLDELVEVASEVDLVLISGDVFETSNPPIEAEELFFDGLARLGNGGQRAVVVIAGNHDSPDRLRAANPLAARHGVWIFGRPGDLPIMASPNGPRSRVELVGAAPSRITLDVRTGQGVERAVVAALPYPSEARLRQLLSIRLEEQDRHLAYNRKIAAAFAKLAEDFEPDAVNLAMSHLAVKSCMPRSSERELVGGAYQVDAAVFPHEAQYVALGHLHLAQPVADAPVPTRYAGAPFAMRFSERDDPRVHTIVEVNAGTMARIEEIPVSAGRPLVVWEAESIAAVEAGVEAGEHANAWIDLRIAVDEHLTHQELASLKALPRDFVRVQAILPEANEVTPLVREHQRRELPMDSLFRSFFREQTGTEPDSALVELFVELAGEVAQHEEDVPLVRKAG